MRLQRLSHPPRQSRTQPAERQDPLPPQRAVRLLTAGGDVRMLDDIFRDVVRIALSETGSVAEAARTLGVGRSSLYRWLQAKPELRNNAAPKPAALGRRSGARRSTGSPMRTERSERADKHV